MFKKITIKNTLPWVSALILIGFILGLTIYASFIYLNDSKFL